MSKSFKGWTEKSLVKLNVDKKLSGKVKKVNIRERAIAAMLTKNNIEFQEQYKFHPDRRFRFDFALVKEKIAIEYEGGTWGRSRHTSAAGYARDVEKYRLAVLLGWRLLRYTVQDIEKGKGYQGIITDINNLL